ncbi:MAG TPA: outer membrane lipoprotein chaperone LolA [Burkholderiales bacterium]|nr:outer membrane lipoprotein chaperone LolA [Burkholderiales bacterium]
MRWLAVLLFAVSALAQASSIDRFKAYLTTTRSMRAAFEQKVYDRSRRLVQESSGSFVLQRPGRFRWTYDKPSEQVIVGDGQRVWIYDKELNQVTVRKLSRALGATPAALLAGSSDVERTFDLSDAGEQDGLEWLEAKPKDREAGFDRIRIGLGASGVQAMELTDNFGQTTSLRFSSIVRNPQVDPGLFRFEPPKGADVLGDK